MHREKKDLLFVLSGPRKKNLFGDEMNAPRSSLFTQHLITMAASSLTAAALGSKVAFANKVRFMSAARCVDSSAFFLFLLLFRTRARFVRKGMSEMFFSVKFYHLSLCTRGSQSEEKGPQNAFFYYEENTSRDVNEDLFDRE